MEYEDDKGMEKILIPSKILMKAYAERTKKYEHQFGTHRDFQGGGSKIAIFGQLSQYHTCREYVC